MVAVRAVAFARYGSADVLELRELAPPTAAAGEVLVRVAAAAANPGDVLFRSGRLRLVVRPALPAVPGYDLAGVVEALGAGVTGLRVGDAVHGMLSTSRPGAAAELVSVPADALAPVPPGTTLVEAAALPLAGLTALQGLRDRGRLAPGQRVLVVGASGGVGSLAVQVARVMGAHVTGVTSGRNAELVRALGADAVLDHTRTDPTAAPAGGRGVGYDVVLDAVADRPPWRWRRVLRPGGRVVSLNPVYGNPVSAALVRAATRTRVTGLLVRPSGTDLAQLDAWVAAGLVRPVVDSVLPLARAAEAHRRLETRRTRGKIVLVVDDDLAHRRADPAA